MKKIMFLSLFMFFDCLCAKNFMQQVENRGKNYKKAGLHLALGTVSLAAAYYCAPPCTLLSGHIPYYQNCTQLQELEPTNLQYEFENAKYYGAFTMSALYCFLICSRELLFARRMTWYFNYWQELKTNRK